MLKRIWEEEEEVESRVEMLLGTIGLERTSGGDPLPLYLSHSAGGTPKFLRWNSSTAPNQSKKGA